MQPNAEPLAEPPVPPAEDAHGDPATDSPPPVAALELMPGTPVQLDVIGLPERLSSRLVGYEVERFVALKLPVLPRSLKIPNVFAAGTKLVTRYVHAGAAFGFRSDVLAPLYAPVRLLLVTYPDAVEDFKIREHPRVDCRLPCEMELEGEQLTGHVLDISRSGCRIEVRGAMQRQAAPGESLVLSVLLPGLGTPVRLEGELRNVQRSRGQVALGVLFRKQVSEAEASLKQFVEDAGG